MSVASYYTAQVTPEGFTKLNSQLANLKEQYFTLINDLKSSEDSPDSAILRTEIMLAQSIVMNKIKSFEKIIATARLIQTHEITRVGIGCTVQLADSEGDKLTVVVVESIEADPFELKISAISPLGKALFNKKKGDVVSYVRPNGVMAEYTITDIR